MVKLFSAAAGCLALASAVVAQTEYIFEEELGATYRYAVHQPSNWTDETIAPPAILFLGGTGSRYIEGQTQAFERVVSFGGPGWRIDRYNNGSREEADVLAAEQFLAIIPVYEEERPDHEWDIPGVQAVLENARSKFAWDDSRLYLSTYSMGARTAWPMLIANSTMFAAATIAAGVPVLDVNSRTPDINFTGMDLLGQIPIMQYAGEMDYENASQTWEHQAVQEHMEGLGFTNVQLEIVPGAQHGDMQQAPFEAELFYFLLNQTGTATAADVMASGEPASIGSTPTDSAALAAASDNAADSANGAVEDDDSSATTLLFSCSLAGLMAVAGLCVL